MSEEATIRARIPEDLKTEFEDACKRNDQTCSQVLREFMRHYVKQNAQGDLLKGKK
jgi:antitoxin component of RelBE/YafQ-DinJ toxin-antitoxin module